MVGVPGKSKGCNTCRRRKKGCDQQEPSCGQCVNAGLKCEGYARATIFVNTGPNILRPGERTIGIPRELQQTSLISSLSTIIHLPPNCSSTVNRQQITSLFRSRYIPDTLYKESCLVSTPGFWVDTILSMSMSERSLELSYVAVSCGRIGKDMDDPRLLQQGWKAYCAGIQELQRALLDPNRMLSDETLAASMMLALYEVFEGVSPGYTAWMTHVRGATKLMVARQPASHSSELAHRLFLGHRLQEIISALRTREPSPFASKPWLTLPFHNRVKDLREELFDILLQVPGVAGKAFKLCTLANDDPSQIHHLVPEQLVQLLEQFQRLDSELVNWYGRARNASAEPLFYRVLLTPEAREQNSLEASVTFPDIRTGHTLAIYWTTCHTVYERMHQLYNLLLRVIAVQGLTDAFTSTLPSPPARTNPTAFALLATESVEYFLQPSMRAMGRTLASFPTMAALDFFARNPVPDPLDKGTLMRWFVAQARKIDMRGMPAPFPRFVSRTAAAAAQGLPVKQYQ